jgi:S-adenosylmethionine synthetase
LEKEIKMGIFVTHLDSPPLDEEQIEIVERKGIGHPDTLSDALAEEYSVALSKFYLEKFGKILHHNVDKALLVGGRALPKFGGGEIISPITFYLVGRATTEVNDRKVPVEDLYLESAQEWIRRNFGHLDPEKHLNFNLIVRPGSPDLVDLFLRMEGIPLSNDTSFGAGFAPLTETENLVFEIERFLNSDRFKREHPEVGEDIKVMGVRNGDRIRFTISIAFISSLVSSLKEYLLLKREVEEKITQFMRERTDREIQVSVNTADDEERESVFITVTGTSAEGGDDGQVGRGNRSNGLITPMRPMSLEAVAGKNPISHVGKLYNVLARDVAEEIIREIEEVKEAHVFLVSQIGKPITEPQIAEIRVRTEKGELTRGIREKSTEILKSHLHNLPLLWKRIVNREIVLY